MSLGMGKAEGGRFCFLVGKGGKQEFSFRYIHFEKSENIRGDVKQQLIWENERGLM